MPDWLQRDWCSSFVLTLGHFLWQGMLIAGLLAIALRVVRSVAARYWLSLVALLLMAVCPIATLGWLLLPESPAAVVAPAIVREEPVPTQAMMPVAPIEEPVDVADVSNVPVMPSSSPPLELDADGSRQSRNLQQATDDRSWWQQFAPHLMATYLGGVALMLLRLVVGLWGGRRLRRRVQLIEDSTLLAAMQRQATALGLKLLPVLAYCERVTVPTVVGVLKPMILLPVALTSGLSPEQIESVLAHELAHLRRYDHLVNLLQRVIESLLFFHPAMWWVSHCIRQEREHCCDDLVVACGAIPLDYAKSLLRVAELSRATKLRRAVSAVSLLATDGKPSNLRQRIARLLGESATPSLRLSPRALLLTLAIPLVALILTIQSGASSQGTSSIGGENDLTDPRSQALPGNASPEAPPQIPSDAASKSRSPLTPLPGVPGRGEQEPQQSRSEAEPRNEKLVWGEVVSGLRARVVPVSAGMSDEVISLTPRATAFETLDEVTFAVEIQNASDKPVSLRELKYGANYGESKGKLASDWFGQFLFSIEYYDANGKLVERPQVISVGKRSELVVDGTLQTTLAPQQSVKMLLRPNHWISALSQMPLIGKQRAVLKYRATVAAEGVGIVGEVVAPAVEFSVKKRGHRPSGVPAPQLGDDQKADPELEPDISKQVVWGESVNGLRTALDVVPERSFTSLSHGTKPKLKLLVQNVSDKSVTLATLMWLSELPVKAKNSKDEDIAIRSTWYTGITPVVRVLLKPQQIVTLDAGNLALAVTKERADAFEHVTHRWLVGPRGKYLLQATERFGTSFQLKDGDGKVLVPADGDFKGDLTTGLMPLDVSNEIIEGEIVDAVTGMPVEGTTMNFLVVKPKTATSEETTVANLIWGPKSPSKIYFTIPEFPEDIAQRPDRDELEIRWGVGGHPAYESYAPEARIPLKEFFHAGPKTAREVLSKIKLTPKKKANVGLLPGGRELEVVGVAHAAVVTPTGSQRKANGWWQADGTSLGDESFKTLKPLSVSEALKGSGAKYFREFVLRLQTRPKELATPENQKRPAWNGDLWFGIWQKQSAAVSWDGNSNLLHQHIVGFNDEQPAAFVFYYSNDPIIDAGTIAPDGKISASETASSSIKSWLADVKVASVEKSANETAVKLNRWYSQVISSQVFVQAIALDGTIVTANDPQALDRFVFKLKFEDIDAFFIKVRPMTHRIDCEDIALLPGQQSKPRVIVTPLDECYSITFRKDGRTLGKLSDLRPNQLAENLKLLQPSLNTEQGELTVTSQKQPAFDHAERVVKQLKADGWKWPKLTLTPIEDASSTRSQALPGNASPEALPQVPAAATASNDAPTKSRSPLTPLPGVPGRGEQEIQEAELPQARSQAELGNGKPLKLTLRVVDAATQKAIKNPKVVFSFGDKRWWERAPILKTDEGLVEWEGTRDDMFQWRVMAKGYRPAMTRLITLDEKEVTLNIAMERDAGFSGRVLNAEGQPVAMATVLLATRRSEAEIQRGELSWRQPLPGYQGHRVETDIDGNFTLPAELDPYVIVVTSKAHGFKVITEKDVVDRSNVMVSLQKWMRLEGTLQREGKPLSGELIRVPYHQEYGDSRINVGFDEDATTGEDGRFVIERVASGRVPIGSWKEKFEPSGVSRSLVQMFYVEGRAGQTIRFTMGNQQRTAVGRLMVVGDENKPAGPTPDWSRYRLMIEDVPLANGQKGNREVKLESDGRFRIEGIQAGDYSTDLEPLDPSDRQWVYWTHGITIPLCDDAEKDRVVEMGDITVYSRKREMTPKDARSQALPGNASPEALPQVPAAATASNDAPTKSRSPLTPLPGVPGRGEQEIQAAEVPKARSQAELGNETTAELGNEKNYRFTGTVVDARGNAVSGALVLYPVSLDRVTWKRRTARAVTNERGEFSTLVLPGQACSLQVISFSEGASVLHPNLARVAIRPDATDFSFDDIECEPARKLTGKLIDENNRPIEGKYVGPSDLQTHAVRTNAAGEFTLHLAESAKPAAWHVVWLWRPEDQITPAEVVTESPLVLRVNRAKAPLENADAEASLSVPSSKPSKSGAANKADAPAQSPSPLTPLPGVPGRGEQGIEAEPQKSCSEAEPRNEKNENRASTDNSLTVIVKSHEDGRVLVGAEVALGWESSSMVKTNARGEAVFERVSGSEFPIRVRAAGHRVELQTYNVSGSRQRRAEIMLVRGGVISGIAKNEKGEPLAGARITGIDQASSAIEFDEVVSDRNGRFRLDYAPLEKLVEINGLHESYQTPIKVELTLNGTTQNKEPITIAFQHPLPPGVRQALMQKPKAAKAIGGAAVISVLSHDNKPLSRVKVQSVHTVTRRL